MRSSRNADIHCHLLPAWDDGPRTQHEAVEMARRAAQHGITDIFVTPHVGRDLRVRGAHQTASSQEIAVAVAALQAVIHKAGLELNLWPGAELVLAPDLPARLEGEPGLTLGGAGRYALVELVPGAPWTSGVDEVLFQTALRGVTPIVAHPERYPDIQRDLGCAQRAAERGVLFQLTASSLQGKGIARDTCYRLLEKGVVSFVASDAHAPSAVWPQQVREILTERLGVEGYEKLEQNALALLPDGAILSEDETKQTRITPALPATKQISANSATAAAGNKRSRPLWARFRTHREP